MKFFLETSPNSYELIEEGSLLELVPKILTFSKSNTDQEQWICFLDCGNGSNQRCVRLFNMSHVVDGMQKKWEEYGTDLKSKPYDGNETIMAINDRLRELWGESELPKDTPLKQLAICPREYGQGVIANYWQRFIFGDITNNGLDNMDTNMQEFLYFFFFIAIAEGELSLNPAQSCQVINGAKAHCLDPKD